MNTTKELTTYDVDRILVMNQMTHYLHLQQSAIAVGDKQEVRRATDILDQLTTEHGAKLLHQARRKTNE
jgi:hypothetical protein